MPNTNWKRWEGRVGAVGRVIVETLQDKTKTPLNMSIFYASSAIGRFCGARGGLAGRARHAFLRSFLSFLSFPSFAVL